MALDRILVPLDGSRLADGILSQVRRLLVRADAEVNFLHVLESGVAGPADACEHVEGLAMALEREGARVATHFVHGDPAVEIVRAAEDLDVGLTAMATHGRSGVSRLLRGSVAERVLRESTRPLLLANPSVLAEAGGPLRIRRILVPVDGSEEAGAILPLVTDVARCFESEVLLLRVEYALGLFNGLETEPVDPSVTALRPLSTVRASLGPIRRDLEAQGLRVRTLATYGSEADEILYAADREDVDLVAMSTHGRSGIARWMQGSVTEQVLRQCSKPLLVRRYGAAAALDGSSASSARLASAR